jgi:hypothetical protein
MSMETSPVAPKWCELDWTDWVPLQQAGKHRSELPSGPGVYRVHLANVDVTSAGQLAYIGQTSRLRGRLASDLRRPVFGEEPPWNDPHAAAPALWAYRVENGAEPHVSAAPAPSDKARRRALEDTLLWRHRRATGRSTLCNYGRFHPRYRRPSNKASGRSMKRRDAPEPETNGPCAAPLPLEGEPTGRQWMSLSWQDHIRLTTDATRDLHRSPGVYRIFQSGSTPLLYIGETTSLRQRLRSHARRGWDSGTHLSVASMPEGAPDYQRKEVESDLLGGHFEQVDAPPTCQYGGLPS